MKKITQICAAPPCASSSTNDQRRTRVIAMLHQDIALNFSPNVSSPRTIGDISPNSGEQRTIVDEHSVRYTKAKHVADTSAMVQNALVNMGDVYSLFDGLGIPSPMVADVHELLCEASTVLWRCYAHISVIRVRSILE